MSMLHRAFAFDWGRFDRELRPTIERALRADDVALIRAWCEAQVADLSDPYEGEPLPVDWERQLERADVQEFADYALTAFYDVSADFGLDDDWLEVESTLDDAVRAALLGTVVSSGGHNFDPGRMGSYFRAPAELPHVLRLLRSTNIARLLRYASDVEAACANSGLGIYVTF